MAIFARHVRRDQILARALGIALAAIGAESADAVTYSTSIIGTDFGSTYINQSDTHNISYAAGSGDTAYSAQALTAHGGIATASYGGTGTLLLGANAESFSTFDFAETASAKIKLLLTGFTNNLGAAKARITYLATLHNALGDALSTVQNSVTSCVCEEGAPGFHKFSRTLIFDVVGGDYLDLNLNATVSNFSGQFGIANAYIDPVLTVAGVPEPSSWMLLLVGFTAVGAMARRHAAALSDGPRLEDATRSPR